MKKYSLLIAAALFLTACGPREADFKSQVPERPTFEERATEQPVQIPSQVNYEVVFYPQAPDADWSLPWKEACEEASLILAHYGLMGESLTKDEFRELVLEMVDWQEDYFGYFEDTTLYETEEMYKKFFPDAFETKIIENPNLKQLKSELAAGNLVVAPFAGRMLGNPFYTGEGPYYHMLVVKGYDEQHFITNDVGTRRGHNFIYPYSQLMSAIHDYVPRNIQNAPSRVLVLVSSGESERP